jgi:predicted LPLAT superfamily acyltransferase
MTSPTHDSTASAPRPADWAEPGIGPGWRFKFFSRIMRVGGTARGYHLADFAAVWYVLFYPSIRRRCAAYLSRRFPGRRSPVKRLLDTFRVVRAYAATLVDTLVLSMYGSDAFTARSRDHEALREIARNPRGFVLLLGHVGCWQIGMSALGQLNKNVSVVMIPATGTGTPIYSVIDARYGLGASMQMTDRLLNGEVVAMMGDRTFGGDQATVVATFLGDPAHFPVSPFRMASATGVPVAVMTAPRVGKRRYEMRLEAVIDVPAGLGRNPQRYAPFAQQFAECMERFVEEFPYQFYNFFDLWQPPKPTAPTPDPTPPPSA